MNLARIVAATFRRAPASVRGTVTFTNPKTGETTTGEAVGIPASGTLADGFQAGELIRARNRMLSVLPDGLAFPPTPAMQATWEGGLWNVLSAPPVTPNGVDVLLYRVALQR